MKNTSWRATKGPSWKALNHENMGSIALKAGIPIVQVCIMSEVSKGGNAFIHSYNTG